MEILKYLSLFLMACFKSTLPAMVGPLSGFSKLEIIIITILGLMTSTLIFNFLGEIIKARIIPLFIKQPKRFSKKSRRMVRIWRRYGVAGTCFITPVLLSPAVGALFVTTMGAPRSKIFLFMLISGIFWGITWAYSIGWLIEIGLMNQSI